MSIKTISIRGEVYLRLKEAKREEESFSDVIERLLRKEKTELKDYFGALKGNAILDGLEEDSRRIRESSKARS